VAQQTAEARVHERRMAQWNAQHMQDEMRREEERRYAQQRTGGDICTANAK